VLPSLPETKVEFRILGPLEVVEEGRPLTLGGPRQRALLAILLTRANEVVSNDRLIDELWGGRPPRTAANALQYHVSQLRKTLGPTDAIVTREPGYLIRVAPHELDLLRFEQLVEEATRTPADRAGRLLRDALSLWRGPALADLASEPFAQAEILRLEEVRLAALELRIENDLALGRHRELVGELEVLVHEHPLRERPRAQLMLALYRSGRQAEALDLYREGRRLLVDELGIEPGLELQELEKAILGHDPELSSPGAAATTPAHRRTIVVVTGDADELKELLTIAEPLARQSLRGLILTRLMRERNDVATATAELAETRSALADRGVAARVAAYTSTEPGSDAALLATEHDAELLLVPASRELLQHGHFDDDLIELLERAPCDVALLAAGGGTGTGPVVTPFGGVEHDWSAIEVAAWIAGSLGTTLRLLGTEADLARGRRDASRLLGRASLMVQQVVGIVTEPVLIPAGEEGVVQAAQDARLLVVGLSDRWRTDGIGPARLSVAAAVHVPTLFVRRGLRPSGIAPQETFTRFTWTLAGERGEKPPDHRRPSPP
jgi:DNA-binding SARP family transcriptional activator